jgi:hypothetical protein
MKPVSEPEAFISATRSLKIEKYCRLAQHYATQTLTLGCGLHPSKPFNLFFGTTLLVG